MSEPDLLAELDAAEHCPCGRTHEQCAEEGGGRYTREREELARLRAIVRQMCVYCGTKNYEPGYGCHACGTATVEDVAGLAHDQ